MAQVKIKDLSWHKVSALQRNNDICPASLIRSGFKTPNRLGITPNRSALVTHESRVRIKMLVSDDAKALEIVKALSDEYSRRIILSLISRSLPIEDISREQHIPASTCYRRIHELQTSGIVRADKIVVQEDGKKFICYRTAFKNASISLESDGLKVEVEPNRVDASERLHEMWFSVRGYEGSRSSAGAAVPIPVTHPG
jgi:DNA-binding Lrp family transcriptional regulator